MPAASVSIQLLLGDVNGNGSVNASDIGQVKAHVGAPVGASNFRSDITANGSINGSDVGAVKAAAGGSASLGTTRFPASASGESAAEAR